VIGPRLAARADNPRLSYQARVPNASYSVSVSAEQLGQLGADVFIEVMQRGQVRLLLHVEH